MTIPYGSQFLINTSSAGDQNRPTVTALADGRFVVVWEDYSDNSPDTSQGAIRAQIYDADGAKTGEEFVVNTTTDRTQFMPSVAAMADGRFVVSWTDASRTGPDTVGLAVRAQVFNSDGTKSGAEILANTVTAGDQVEPSTAVLTNGRFVVTWSDTSLTAPDTDSGGIRAQTFNADGTKFGSEFQVNSTTARAQFDPGVQALTNGRFLVTWSESDTTGQFQNSRVIRAQLFDANGAKVGLEFALNPTTAGSESGASVTALANGRFVVTWTDSSAAAGDLSGNAVRAQVFSANGTKSGAEILVNTTTESSQSFPDITALSDGRFVVTWQDQSATGGDTSNSAIRAQVFLANGTKSGEEFLVNTGTFGDQANPSITALADGRVVIAWVDFSESSFFFTSPDRSGSAVLGQIFDPREGPVKLGGTALADQFVGTAFADSLAGRTGNDVLVGAEGADQIAGGDGQDRLVGDAGADRIAGGAGSDQIVGGLGRDKLAGDGGADDFVFLNALEIGLGRTGDVLLDFRVMQDDIDLSAFMAGGQFIGRRAFTATEGEVRYTVKTGLLQGDVDGDGRADWSMVIGNKAGLGAQDFIF